MAVLNKIRQRSFFLILIIALALFSFVLADLFRSGGSNSQKSQNTIASVNGTDIDRIAFAEKVEDASRKFGGNASSLQAVNYIWNQELKQVLFEEQFEKLGITIGKDHVNDLLEKSLVNNTTFQNEAGVFEKAKMYEYVANIKATSPQQYQQWLTYETSVSKGAKEDMYLNMIKAGAGATLKEGELAYIMENTKADIKYVQLPFSSIKDEEITVSDSEIQSYINTNEDAYKADATVDLNYVFFKEEASEADKTAITKEITQLLDTSISYNNETTKNDTLPGLKTTTAHEEFILEYSDLKFEDRFVFKKELPSTVADTISNLPVGKTYGPYTDGEYTKITKVIARKQLPDSIKAKHILIAWEGLRTAGELKRTKEEAKTLADSIFSISRTSNDSIFAALASKHSADTSNKDKGGDLGYFGPGTMVPAFNTYCLDNAVGDQGIVETQFGYHIIKIEDKKNIQDAVKLATVALKIEPSEETINDIFTETTKFQIDTKDAKFDEVAKTKNYEARPVNKVKELDETIPGIGKQRAIVQWAFNTEEANIGDVKRFEVTGGYAVVQLTNRIEKGVMSIADASTLVKPILINEKKAALLKNKIKGTTLADIAKNQGQTVKSALAIQMKNPTVSGAGTEPTVVGTAFGLPQGQVSKPIIGKNGVYVIEVTKQTPGAGLESYKSYAAQASKSVMNTANSKVFEALKEKAEIEDRRAKFY